MAFPWKVHHLSIVEDKACLVLLDSCYHTVFAGYHLQWQYSECILQDPHLKNMSGLRAHHMLRAFLLVGSSMFEM